MSELVSSVFTIVQSVMKWVETKQELREQADSFVMHLTTIRLALNVVQKNPAACQEDNIHELLKIIHHAVRQGALLMEKVAITTKSWFYRPEKYLEQLAKHDKQLDRIVPVLTLALVPFQQIQRQPVLPGSTGAGSQTVSNGGVKAKTKVYPADLIQDAEGLKFWTDCFKDKIDVPVDVFVDEFLIHFELSRVVEDDGKEALRMTVDESGDGVVTALEFQNVLSQFTSLSQLIDQQIRPQSQEQQIKIAESDEKQTTAHMSQEDMSKLQSVDYDINVLWVIAKLQSDDRKLVAEAEAAGQKVLCLPSPGAAMEYLDSPGAANLLYKKKDFRILTQNLSYNPNFDMVPNGLSAEQIVRFIKKKRSRVPILIYCLKSIKEAEVFAKKYDGVWATCTHKAARSWVQFEPLASIKKLGSLEELKQITVERRGSKSKVEVDNASSTSASAPVPRSTAEKYEKKTQGGTTVAWDGTAQAGLAAANTTQATAGSPTQGSQNGCCVLL